MLLKEYWGMVRKAVANAADEQVGALNVAARAAVPATSGRRSHLGIGRVHCKEEVGFPRGIASADDLGAAQALQPLDPASSFAFPYNKKRKTEQSQSSSVLDAVDLDIVPMVQQQHSPQHRLTGGAMEPIGACEVAMQSHKDVRWIYECILVDRNFEVLGGSGRRVVSITICDNTGPVLVPAWDQAVDVLDVVVAESYDKASLINLRFEKLRVSHLSKNSWNGDIVTPIHQGHTINITGLSKDPGRSAGSAVAPVSARDGTRLVRSRNASLQSRLLL